MLLKCVPHVQYDYFSSFKKSGNCFLASSLPLPSFLLKLPLMAAMQSGFSKPFDLLAERSYSTEARVFCHMRPFRAVWPHETGLPSCSTGLENVNPGF